MNGNLIRFLGLIALISLVIYFLNGAKLTSDNSLQKSDVKSASSSDVPEMSEILGNDQETRLKAARKLVERVDVEQALEILEHSTLPHTGEGHLAVHQIGFYAYQKYGVDSILKCKDYFLYACYHGAIIEAATDQGFDAVSKMTDRCKESPVRYFQCVHAAGHAILAMWNYDLPNALDTCDDLYEKEVNFPNALSSCHNGSFMENLFGVHDWGKDKEIVRDWLKDDDPYFPCNYFDEKYQRGCWLNQAARIYQMNNGDIAKTAQICQQIGNSQYTTWCMDNLARQIHPLTNGDIVKVFTLCPLVGDAWRESCITVNAGAYYSVGGRNQAIAVCQRTIPQTKTECYQLVSSQIISDPITKDEKAVLCQKLEPPFNEQCILQLSQIN